MAKAKTKTNKGIVLIKKSNNLVESRYKFDIWETRFFLSVLSQIRKEDTDFEVYRIWYKDVIKTFGLKSGDSYASLRDAAKSLLGKPVHINYELDGVKRGKMVNLIRAIDYLEAGQEKVENHEYIDVKVEHDLKPLLLQLQRNFTAYDLRNVVKLGVYSVRLYELLKQYESIGTRTMRVDEMKNMFQVEELYKLFADFYRWVIAPAEKEINQHTDLLLLDIEKIKEGKKVVALRFKFRTKTEEELNRARGYALQSSLFDNMEEGRGEAVQSKRSSSVPEMPHQINKDKLFLAHQALVVGTFGVSPSVFLAELDHCSEEQVTQAIRVTQRAQKDGKIKNLSGFFIESLRKGFTDPKEELFKKQAKETAAKAHDAAITAQMEVLQDELAGQINEVIRNITTQDPGTTEMAINSIREYPIIRDYIEKKEATLQRLLDVDDFRNDKKLRDWVKNEIVVANKAVFEPVFAEYEVKMKALKASLNRHKI